jgi:hypothetical protein
MTNSVHSFLKHRILLIATLLLVSGQAVMGQYTPTENPPGASQDAVKIGFRLSGPPDVAGKVRVMLTAPPNAAVTSNDIPKPADGEYIISVRLVDGTNTITVIGFNVATPVVLATHTVTCGGRWCSAPLSLTPASVAVPGTAPGVAAPAPVAAAAAATSGIVIESPAADSAFQDETFIRSSIKVSKLTISKVFVRVLNKGKPIAQPENTFAVEKNNDGTIKPIKARIRIGPGANEISAFDPDTGVAGPDSHTVVVNCAGDNCGTESDVATIVTNSQNTRAVVGMEQAGASSTTSETKPFLDFFFTAPLLFTGKAPRIASWAQIRLASTPDQLSTTSIFPTNLVNQVSQSGTAASLVQSFDFLAGLEIRAATANDSFLGFIPGIKQKTRFYIAAGGGAISPLTARKENALIFKIPGVSDSQYDLFVDRYGKPPTGKEFVAFVPLDRDRFLRQWYAGIRLKTYYCEDQDCTRFRNNFPGIVDLMVGQNEAVTGGSRKYGGVPDPLDSSKIIGEKNAYVLRLDAFYPLPFREASFIYLYGTAMMKIGGGRVKIINPLFLDPATSPITDPKVFIPSSDLQQLLQPNRDYYKIGVGINLTDLFNRSRNPPQ